MNNIIAIDVGTVYVGVAKQGVLSNTATPIGVYKRQKNIAEKKILDIINENQIKTLVVGLPLSENGSENKQCEDVRNFIRRIEKRSPVKIILQDEYASSLEAKEILKAKRKFDKNERVDAIAACIILESYFKNE